MANQQISMPGVFGGLTRYNEAYNAKFVLSPAHVVGFIVFILVFVLALKFFFPVVS